MKKLYIFPVKYPFTNNIECFLHDEVPYLAKNFEEVIFVPLKKEITACKDLPLNCKVIGPVFKTGISFIFNGLYCRRTFRMLCNDFLINNVCKDFRKLRIWVIGYITINNILNSRLIKEIESKLTFDDICYFYWGKWSNVLSCLWNNVKSVSRFHGWGDLWESDYNNYFPLRKQVVHSLEYAVHISSIGEKYFSNKYPDCKTKIYRLGSFDNGIRPLNEVAKDAINIVSCSSLWPLKRVNLILDSVVALANYTEKKIKWTHIGGDGKSLEKLKKAVESVHNKRISINICGTLPHNKVLEYYKTHLCDLFINLSTTEGVPVSIMEAISFDIPVIATNVGGTSDIVVNWKSGILVSKNPSKDEVAKAIMKIIETRSSFSPRNYWNEYYNAEQNYSNFARFLKSL